MKLPNFIMAGVLFILGHVFLWGSGFEPEIELNHVIAVIFIVGALILAFTGGKE